MQQCDDSYINGVWTPATGALRTSVTDSFTEETFATYQTSSAADVDAAVHSARRAFDAWSQTPLAERIAAVHRIAAALREQAEALGRVISREVGMPAKLASRIQVAAPIAAWDTYASLAADLHWEERIGNSLVQQVPVGVVACITPWNYPPAPDHGESRYRVASWMHGGAEAFRNGTFQRIHTCQGD